MKAFIAAVIFSALFAVGAAIVLGTVQQPGHVKFTTSGARVGDPGHNLTGPS